MQLMSEFLLWCSQNEWMTQNLPRYGFVKRAVKRFMPGEDLESALIEAKRLHGEGVSSILTLLGENVTNTKEADEVTRHYLHLLDEIAKSGLPIEVSIKPTHLGLDLGKETVIENLRKLAGHAAKSNNFVWVDMESSSYVDATLELFRQVGSEHKNTGLCIQSYLYRTEKDLESLLPIAAGLRLVKGAYSEPADIAFPKKSDVDKKFWEISKILLETIATRNGLRPGFGTHDGTLIKQILLEARDKKIDESKFEIQFMYGIGRHAQKDLVKSGYKVRVLISYGPSWFPWYMRRLAERPANVGFVIRSLFS